MAFEKFNLLHLAAIDEKKKRSLGSQVMDNFVNLQNQLGKFMLNDIPPQPRQYPDIEVTFAVNVDGILEVTAVEKTGGQEKAIKIKNDKGTLTVNEIERMVGFYISN